MNSHLALLEEPNIGGNMRYSTVGLNGLNYIALTDKLTEVGTGECLEIGMEFFFEIDLFNLHFLTVYWKYKPRVLKSDLWR